MQMLKSPEALIEETKSYSGYVRQTALDDIQQAHASKACVRAVMLRLNDWVPNVRRSADKALERLWPLITPDMILAALPEIQGLQRAGRANHSALIKRLELHMLSGQPATALQRLKDAVHGAVGSEAMFCFDVLRKHADMRFSDLCRLGLSCPHMHIARIAAQQLRKLAEEPAEQAKLVQLAMQSPFAMVRMAALRAAMPPAGQSFPTFLLEAARQQLTDRSAGLRNLSVFILGGASTQLAQHALDVWQQNSLPTWRRAAALCLLGELGSHAPCAPVLEALHHPLPSIRRTAYGAAFKLGAQDADGLILRALQDPSASVRRAAVQWARRLKTCPNADALCALASQLDDAGLHCLLQIMELGNPWEKLLALLEMPPLAKQKNRATLLTQHAGTWLRHMNNCFVQPTPAQRSHINALLRAKGLGVFALHKNDLAYCLERFSVA